MRHTLGSRVPCRPREMTQEHLDGTKVKPDVPQEPGSEEEPAAP